MTNNSIDSGENQEINTMPLSDYVRKKKSNLKLNPMLIGKISDKGHERVEECGANLLFLANSDKSKHRLKSGFFCHNRWCPYCAWRKARKDSMKLSVIMEMMSKKLKYEFLFVTLTTPNVKAEKLDDEIKHFNKSFTKMMKRSKIRGWGNDYRGNAYTGVVKGYVKKLEVTYNEKRDDYNPHLHCVFAVRKNYFTKNYIKQSDWLDLWRDCTGQSEITQVSIQKVKMDNQDKAVKEVAKYSAKDSDYLLNQEVFDNFFASMKHKRLMVYGGCMYDYSKDYESGKLDEYKLTDKNEYLYMLLAKFNYDTLTYERKYRNLTHDEKIEYFNTLID